MIPSGGPDAFLVVLESLERGSESDASWIGPRGSDT